MSKLCCQILIISWRIWPGSPNGQEERHDPGLRVGGQDNCHQDPSAKLIPKVFEWGWRTLWEYLRFLPTKRFPWDSHWNLMEGATRQGWLYEVDQGSTFWFSNGIERNGTETHKQGNSKSVLIMRPTRCQLRHRSWSLGDLARQLCSLSNKEKKIGAKKRQKVLPPWDSNPRPQD